jgi:EAL domain-containing protein (putative c-di-GMP-specific phosphodiesterase class I)
MLEDRGAVQTVFQPIVDIRTGLLGGYEALSRFMAQPEGPPNVWFDMAHRCGLGPRLEAEAMRLALSRGGGRPAGTFLSVNLSPSALLSEEVQDVLPEDMSDLVIEVTENELITEHKGVPSALSAARERGAKLAVDDAGAGYAGLQQLMRLRPDIIKLDRALVDGVHTDLAKSALVDSLVRYARKIGASVCAEGIESLEDLRTLVDLDVAYGQGYVLARPGPPWAFVSTEASAVCSDALGAVMRHEELSCDGSGSTDLRLEQLTRRVFEADRPTDLSGAMPLVAAELQADEVTCQELDEQGSCLKTVAFHGWQTLGDGYALADLPASEHVLATGEALQVFISDPDADGAELDRMVAGGIKSLLKIPIMAGRQPIGMLEAGSHAERSWTHSEIHRGRVIAYQLGAVLNTFRHPTADGVGRLSHSSLPSKAMEGIRRRMEATTV